jgi:8-oxo-dGTP pyrophosphatase MutT (NUDIX family)
MSNDNPDGLRMIDRQIASVILISSDNHVLMGRKDPTRGGVYSDTWHIPGGGIKDGESLIDAAIREVREETTLVLQPEQLSRIDIPGGGATEKTLSSGEKVWCRMTFNRFEARLDKTAAELAKLTAPTGDLIELRWFSPEELPHVEQIPGGKEFFIAARYI